MNDNYGIMEAIQQLQNAKTATEIQQAAEFFTLIIEENKQLKEQLRQLNLSDMSKEQSSIDYYRLYRELKAENKALKERLYKSFELRLELNQKFWRVCGEAGRVFEFIVIQINICTDEISYIDDSFNDFSVDEIGETVFLTKAEAEARLKELKGEKQ